MLTPMGESAGNIDRIMLLAMWVRELQSKGRQVIAACMGKPTFATNEYAASIAAKHWSDTQFSAQKSHHFFRNNANTGSTRDKIVKMGGVIDYGDPQGDADPRKTMSQALTRWYNEKITIEPEHILFTVGGAGAIHCILSVLNKESPNGKVITPFPHYTLYATTNKKTRLHPIHVMNEPGYRLTANSLEQSISTVDGDICAFLFCDPNNPLGTITSPEEWASIATILKKHPNVPIILDEAYAEMRLDGAHYQSVLEIAPELYSRIILIRSATKALSAAGQRMAVLVTPNSKLMTKFLAKSITLYGHAPRSDQNIFAHALENFDQKDREDLAKFYLPQVDLTLNRLREMGATMPDEDYKVEGTFYVLADLSDLLGIDIPLEVEAALGKSGKIISDEDIVYYLMFKGVAVAPLSYFGINSSSGFVRITCSSGDTELNRLCDIIENILTDARKLKAQFFEKEISYTKSSLEWLSSERSSVLVEKYSELFNPSVNLTPKTALQLKNFNELAQKYVIEHKEAMQIAKKERFFEKYGSGLEDKNVVEHKSITLQSFIRSKLARDKSELIEQKTSEQWAMWVGENYHELPELRDLLLKFNLEQRSKYKPWMEYLHNKQYNIVTMSLTR